MAKVQLGLKNIHVTMLTEGVDSITFGETKKWPGAVNVTLEWSGENNPWYADDGVYYLGESTEGLQIEVENALVPEWFFTDIFGGKKDDDGNIVEQVGDKAKPFSLAFEFTTDEKAIKHRLFYCMASKPSEEGSTKADKVEPKTAKMKITGYPLPGTNFVRTRTSETTTPEAYEAFYTTPKIPVFTPPTP